MQEKSTSQIVGVDDIHIEIILLVLKDGRHVSGLCLNLLSVEELDCGLH